VIEPPERGALDSRLANGIRTSLWGIEELLYVIVGVLLLAAAVLVVVGTVTGLINAIKLHSNAVDTGVVVLDRVLLTLIVAELLHTLRFVVLRGQIVVEPFLFVGLIAVVRRILVITAGLERQTPTGHALTNLLLELGLLGFLTLALATAIYMMRRGVSGQAEEPDSPGIDSLPGVMPSDRP
jgi:uncharacterized membrane protein (DUF373 family)